MFFSVKQCRTRIALELLLLQVNSPDVSLVALLPSELHPAILALKLFLCRVHGSYVKGQAVISSVYFAANGASHLVVVMNVADVLLQVAHESEGGRALLALERA